VQPAERDGVVESEPNKWAGGWPNTRPLLPADGHTPGLGIGIIGCGYWGPQLVRNMHDIAQVDRLAVADIRSECLAGIARRYPSVRLFTDHRELLAAGLDAIVVASPIHTHYALVREALLAGKHVLVEKPMATNVREAAELVELADRLRLVIMAGHTFLYHPVVRELRRRIHAGELGRIRHGDSARLNLGIFQRHANVAWDLAPHDISMLMYLLDQEPVMVGARAWTCVRDGLHDVCHLEIQFSAGTSAHVHVSWFDPDKVRRLTLLGDRRMAVFDDLAPDAKLRIHDSGVEDGGTDDGGGFVPTCRHGQVVIPPIEWHEPLHLECEDFVRCVLHGGRPVSDDRQGFAVVAALEAAQRSIDGGGVGVPVESGPVPAIGPRAEAIGAGRRNA
jgi:predicted dehydrogenase